MSGDHSGRHGRNGSIAVKARIDGNSFLKSSWLLAGTLVLATGLASVQGAFGKETHDHVVPSNDIGSATALVSFEPSWLNHTIQSGNLTQKVFIDGNSIVGPKSSEVYPFFKTDFSKFTDRLSEEFQTGFDGTPILILDADSVRLHRMVWRGQNPDWFQQRMRAKFEGIGVDPDVTALREYIQQKTNALMTDGMLKALLHAIERNIPSGHISTVANGEILRESANQRLMIAVTPSVYTSIDQDVEKIIGDLSWLKQDNSLSLTKEELFLFTVFHELAQLYDGKYYEAGLDLSVDFEGRLETRHKAELTADVFAVLKMMSLGYSDVAEKFGALRVLQAKYNGPNYRLYDASIYYTKRGLSRIETHIENEGIDLTALSNEEMINLAYNIIEPVAYGKDTLMSFGHFFHDPQGTIEFVQELIKEDPGFAKNLEVYASFDGIVKSAESRLNGQSKPVSDQALSERSSSKPISSGVVTENIIEAGLHNGCEQDTRWGVLLQANRVLNAIAADMLQGKAHDMEVRAKLTGVIVAIERVHEKIAEYGHAVHNEKGPRSCEFDIAGM